MYMYRPLDIIGARGPTYLDLEGVGDCFEGIVWKNDRQIISWDGSRLFHDKDNPRTELKVSWEEDDE